MAGVLPPMEPRLGRLPARLAAKLLNGPEAGPGSCGPEPGLLPDAPSAPPDALLGLPLPGGAGPDCCRRAWDRRRAAMEVAWGLGAPEACLGPGEDTPAFCDLCATYQSA